jgi:hypothetical protein
MLDWQSLSRLFLTFRSSSRSRVQERDDRESQRRDRREEQPRSKDRQPDDRAYTRDREDRGGRNASHRSSEASRDASSRRSRSPSSRHSERRRSRYACTILVQTCTAFINPYRCAWFFQIAIASQIVVRHSRLKPFVVLHFPFELTCRCWKSY